MIVFLCWSSVRLYIVAPPSVACSGRDLNVFEVILFCVLFYVACRDVKLDICSQDVNVSEVNGFFGIVPLCEG